MATRPSSVPNRWRVMRLAPRQLLPLIVLTIAPLGAWAQDAEPSADPEVTVDWRIPSIWGDSELVSAMSLDDDARPGELERRVILRACTTKMMVKHRACFTNESCTELKSYEAGKVILERERSGEILYVWSKDADGDSFIETFDLSTRQRSGRCTIGDGVRVPWSSGDLTAVAGDNVLLEWSAGTSTVEGHLCNSQGETIQSLGGPVLELGPNNRFAATYPARHTPANWHRSIEVYDLRDGSIAVRRERDKAAKNVELKAWKNSEVVFSIVGTEETIPLRLAE